FEQRVHECGFTFVHDADRAARAHTQPLFSNLLLFGFDAAHWPLWPLLHAATVRADEATVVLSDPRDEARDLDETWVGTWEETFGPAEVIPGTDGESTVSSVESLLVLASNVHFVIGRDTTQQARAIVALAAKFLADPHCERLGILLSGPGALPRLVATFLESAGIAHNDGIAHLAPSAFDDDASRASWRKSRFYPRTRHSLNFFHTREPSFQSSAGENIGMNSSGSAATGAICCQGTFQRALICDGCGNFSACPPWSATISARIRM